MTKDEARELLELIADQAPKLRKAGVFGTVKLEGVEFFVMNIADDGDGAGDDDDDDDDPLNDPTTFGFRKSNKSKQIPGARKPA